MGAAGALLNLIVRRLLSNEALVTEFKIDRAKVLSDFEQQQALFYRFFPQQVEQGPKKRLTLEWMISRCADGTDKTAPREVIHLLNTLREKEIERIERGEFSQPGTSYLIAQSSSQPWRSSQKPDWCRRYMPSFRI